MHLHPLDPFVHRDDGPGSFTMTEAHRDDDATLGILGESAAQDGRRDVHLDGRGQLSHGLQGLRDASGGGAPSPDAQGGVGAPAPAQEGAFCHEPLVAEQGTD